MDRVRATALDGGLRVDVENTNHFPIDLDRLTYGVSLGGARIAASSVAHSTLFEAGGVSTVEIPITVELFQLGVGVLGILQGADAGYRFGGQMLLDAPFGALSLPYDQNGCVRQTH